MEVNGRVERNPALRIDPRTDRVRFDGHSVSDQTQHVTIALHKPKGVITTRTDPGGRATIYDGLGDLGRWLFPVGRLDRDSSGLLLLTNDHRLGQRLTDPAHAVPKTYHVRVAGLPDAQALRALREGVSLDDGPTRPAEVSNLGVARDGGTWLAVVLREGRNRQLRRMGAAVGHAVLELVRVRIGALELGALAPGEWRTLGDEDLSQLGRYEGRRPRAVG